MLLLLVLFLLLLLHKKLQNTLNDTHSYKYQKNWWWKADEATNDEWQSFAEYSVCHNFADMYSVRIGFYFEKKNYFWRKYTKIKQFVIICLIYVFK